MRSLDAPEYVMATPRIRGSRRKVLRERRARSQPEARAMGYSSRSGREVTVAVYHDPEAHIRWETKEKPPGSGRRPLGPRHRPASWEL